MADDAAVTNTKLTPGGNEKTFVIPPDTYRLLIQAVTTDQEMMWASAGTIFTIVAGAPPTELLSRNLIGKTIYFDSATGDVEIMAFTGRMEV